jgi:hypothetical protein
VSAKTNLSRSLRTGNLGGRGIWHRRCDS